MHEIGKEQRVARERSLHNLRFRHPDERSRKVARFYSITRSIHDALRAELAMCIPGTMALEYGCGIGSSNMFRLAQRRCRVLGIDISEVALQQARRRSEGLRGGICFIQMDGEVLGFGDNSFGIIYGAGILHHLDLSQALPEICRVLDPGGFAVFLEPLGHNPFINIYRYFTPQIRTPDEHPLLHEDIRHLSDQFDHVEVRYFYLTAIIAALIKPRGLQSMVLDALESLDARLFRIPGLRRQAWQVLIKLSKPSCRK